MMATAAICIQRVPCSHPSASGPQSILDGVGGGGICAGPRVSRVIEHHMRNITTMTVVICMMRSALALDSLMPFVLLHQKYAITIRAKPAANRFGGTVI